MIDIVLQRKLKLGKHEPYLYRISESQLPFVVLTISFSKTNYYFVCNKSNTTGVASGAEVYILLCHPEQMTILRSNSYLLHRFDHKCTA
jgi:UV DNA damage repair endonuclease